MMWCKRLSSGVEGTLLVVSILVYVRMERIKVDGEEDGEEDKEEDQEEDEEED